MTTTTDQKRASLPEMEALHGQKTFLSPFVQGRRAMAHQVPTKGLSMAKPRSSYAVLTQCWNQPTSPFQLMQNPCPMDIPGSDITSRKFIFILFFYIKIMAQQGVHNSNSAYQPLLHPQVDVSDESNGMSTPQSLPCGLTAKEGLELLTPWKALYSSSVMYNPASGWGVKPW